MNFYDDKSYREMTKKEKEQHDLNAVLRGEMSPETFATLYPHVKNANKK